MKTILSLLCLFHTTLFAHSLPLNSEEGMTRLERSYNLPYPALKQHYEPQLKNYCGVASSIMIFRSLGIRNYTQESFFTEAVLKIRTREAATRGGFSFEELVQSLQTFPNLNVAYIYADSFQTPADLEEALKDLMTTEDLYIIANFNRRKMGQTGGGHYSPIAAYDPQSRSVLVYDVNENYGPYWADLDIFWGAMQRIDDQRSHARGLILLRRQPR